MLHCRSCLSQLQLQPHAVKRSRIGGARRCSTARYNFISFQCNLRLRFVTVSTHRAAKQSQDCGTQPSVGILHYFSTQQQLHSANSTSVADGQRGESRQLTAAAVVSRVPPELVCSEYQSKSQLDDFGVCLFSATPSTASCGWHLPRCCYCRRRLRKTRKSPKYRVEWSCVGCMALYAYRYRRKSTTFCRIAVSLSRTAQNIVKNACA